MMRGRAISAIVFARLRSERRAIAYTAATAIVAGFIAPHGLEARTDPAFTNIAMRSIWLAGPMFFCSALGIIAALLQGTGRSADLDVCELSAPLFGRELARAKALTPCIIATLTVFAYWGAQWMRGFAAPPNYFALAWVTVLAATLIALSSTVRSGASRLLYIALAAVPTSLCYVLAVYFDAIYVGLAIALLAGFIALRQYGEALARFDAV
ncbi:MAG: hypothetical protein ACYDGM_02735 [Vulcanimicrobiaceae bacterium]